MSVLNDEQDLTAPAPILEEIVKPEQDEKADPNAIIMSAEEEAELAELMDD